MTTLPVDEQLVAAGAALEAGRWADALDGFAGVVDRSDSAAALMGASQAHWWLGDTTASVRSATQAYAAFRNGADIEGAVEAATWLALTYKSNYESAAVAEGWLRRAERLLAGEPPGPLHAWTWIVQAYRHRQLAEADELTSRAVEVARSAGSTDLELIGLSQLGRIRVGLGQLASGFALIDEAMAAVLGGERSKLDTVVYVCCDMLTACDLANDASRASQWCRVADDFIATYGCPFLNGECRTLYGGLLAAGGRWDEADQELTAALRITRNSAPRLHAQATVRLARLRLRQGRREEAAALIEGLDASADSEAALTRAALHLARGDDAQACRVLSQRMDGFDDRRFTQAEGLSLLVDAYLSGGDVPAATAQLGRLRDLTVAGQRDRVTATALTAEGRIAAAAGEPDAAESALAAAWVAWSDQQLPFEAACCRYDLADVVAKSRPGEAAELARECLSTFERLGADTEADRTLALLRSLGAPARVSRPSSSLLSGREEEVLELLGLGLSNPEIAQRLFLSRKTVAHHVSSILAKLQVRNRTEAAALAIRRPDEARGTARSPMSRGRSQ